MDSVYSRVAIVTPNQFDAEWALRYLAEHRIAGLHFDSLPGVARALEQGLGCILLVQEAITEDALPLFEESLARQPPWADVPLIIVSRDIVAMGALIERAFPRAGNVTLLESPLNPLSLASALHVALRATRRQIEMRDLLEERDLAVRSRDEFLAMLSHELRNPLAPMRNAVALQKNLGIQDPTFVKTNAILERQMGHVVHMLDDLLDVARLERGKLELKRHPLDLNHVVQGALGGSMRPFRPTSRHFELRLCKESLPMDGDPTRVEQILSNLISNAEKFTSANGTIAVRTEKDAKHAVLHVKDDGVGIAPDEIESLFGLFVQGHQSLARSRGGLGIGLALVRKLTELHGGTITAHSEGPGKGTTFTVRFPLRDFEHDAGRSSAPSRPCMRPRRVLIVEDNADIRETMAMLLSALGHEVILASDGNEGLNSFASESPDIALIDIGLPDIDGYQVAAKIRHQSHKAVRLVALTGYGQDSDKLAAQKAGFDMHLLKPVDPSALEQLLAE